MPEMTGIELLDKMKTMNSTVTRILMSAFEIQDEQFQKCDCVDKFLQKPIHMIDLINEGQVLVANPKEAQILAQSL
jgi:response regulator RpfG family c-di-GMP phosphodiesterase